MLILNKNPAGNFGLKLWVPRRRKILLRSAELELAVLGHVQPAVGYLLYSQTGELGSPY